MKKFLVMLKPGAPQPVMERYANQWQFDNPHDLCIFMWGKSSTHYWVFIRQDDIGGDITHMETVLAERAEQSTLPT